MFRLLQVLAIVLSAIVLAPALAHAFEFPGKKRLKEAAYLEVQAIYYPGFTFLGVCEPGALIAILALLLFTPPETVPFVLTVVALICLVGIQAIYWGLIHPTNKFWLQAAGPQLGNVGRAFFAMDPAGRRSSPAQEGDEWKKFRNRWEYSHIARAALAFFGFVSLVVAVVTET
jgi:hypothetical protein